MCSHTTQHVTAARLGLIVNPVAGMGGPVGLKGTDGDLAEAARGRGARPVSPGRAARALSALGDFAASVRIRTCAGQMGEQSVHAAGLVPDLVLRTSPQTSAMDTRAAVYELEKQGIDLLLFAGGDGTARNILEATNGRTAVVGIPAGVKMHSAVFAATPRAAGDLARFYLAAGDRGRVLEEAEVLDREPDASDPRGSPRLYGVLRIPRVRLGMPGAKASPPSDADASLEGAVQRAAVLARDDRVTLIGPGTTMGRLKKCLGIDAPVLGVAVVRAGRCLDSDADEAGILAELGTDAGRIVVSVVGGQGFLFGRGNQPLSARVIRRVGRENIVVVASLEKLLALPAQGLLVDTGDEALDEDLAGFIHVMVSENRTVVFPVLSNRPAVTASSGTPPGSRR